MEESIRVFIAESDPAQRARLVALVSSQPEFFVLGDSPSGKETLEAVRTKQPDILITSLALRDFDGLFLLESITNSTLMSYPRIAVVSTMPARIGERALELGADIFINKPNHEKELIDWMNHKAGIPASASLNIDKRKEQATDALKYLGMSSELNGFTYLVEAIAYACVDHLASSRMMNDLYPSVAQKFNTTVWCVERAIRHAIEDTWMSGQLSAADQLFGYSVDPKRGKPTNAECIARLADYIRGNTAAQNAERVHVNEGVIHE